MTSRIQPQIGGDVCVPVPVSKGRGTWRKGVTSWCIEADECIRDHGGQPALGRRFPSGGAVEEDLRDLAGLVEGGEVAGLAECDVAGSGEQGLVRGPV